MTKIYSQEDVDAFPVVGGIKRCPSGSYATRIRFPEWCSFGKRSNFGGLCIFGERCSFGELCSFGEWCSFGERCGFGELCSFGKLCSFGGLCIFGERCSFGKRCSFGEGCSFEGGNNIAPTDSNRPYFAVDRIGSEKRKAYFFRTASGFFVRAGCFFGSEDEFITKLHGDNDDRKTREYEAALALAKLVLGD